jgi:phosphoribosylglycinamide formyltransferase-1
LKALILFIIIFYSFFCVEICLQTMKKIVLFASGNGSNAEKIIQHFLENKLVKVTNVFTNNAHAKVLDVAQKYTVDGQIISKEYLNSDKMVKKMLEINPDLIVLAGFLLQFPKSIINKFPNKIVNIHPALLPKYGGKGMYGMHVHNAVLSNKETESGITIHYVNENYDEGEFIVQKSINIEDCTSAEEIANKVHSLEHQYFPVTLENLLIKKP